MLPRASKRASRRQATSLLILWANPGTRKLATLPLARATLCSLSLSYSYGLSLQTACPTTIQQTPLRSPAECYWTGEGRSISQEADAAPESLDCLERSDMTLTKPSSILRAQTRSRGKPTLRHRQDSQSISKPISHINPPRVCDAVGMCAWTEARKLPSTACRRGSRSTPHLQLCRCATSQALANSAVALHFPRLRAQVFRKQQSLASSSMM